MKAISLWQPWASAIALGLKKVETRSRMTRCFGELAICAAKKNSADLEMQLEILRSSNLEVAKGFKNLEFFELPFGSVVAVGYLHCVMSIELIDRSKLSEHEIMLGDYSEGRYGWMFRDVRPLRKPVPVIGRQFLFDLPADVEAKVKAQL